MVIGRLMRQGLRRHERLIVAGYVVLLVLICGGSAASFMSYRGMMAGESLVADAIELRERSLQRRLARAERALAAGDDKQAEARLSAVINDIELRTRTTPDALIRFRAMRLLGAHYAKLQRRDDAVRIFDALAAANPGVAGVHEAYGRALLQLGEAEAAERQLHLCLALNPNAAGAGEALSRHYFQIGQNEKARQVCLRFAQGFCMARGRNDRELGLKLLADGQVVGQWQLLPFIDGREHRYVLAAAGDDRARSADAIDMVELAFDLGAVCGRIEIHSITFHGRRDVRRPGRAVLLHLDGFADATTDGVEPIIDAPNAFGRTGERQTIRLPLPAALVGRELDAIDVVMTAHKEVDAVLVAQIFGDESQLEMSAAEAP